MSLTSSTRRAVNPSRPGRAHAGGEPAGESRSPADEPADHPIVLVPQQLDVHPAGNVERVAARPGRRVRKIGGDGLNQHRLLDGLMPADPRRGADRQLIDRLKSARHCPLRRAHLHLQEPCVHVDLRRARTVDLDQALHAHRRLFADAVAGRPWWTDDAELPAQLILGGRGTVRVEQVPLVQDRVGDRCGVREAHDAGSPVGSSAASSSVARTASQDGSARAALNRARSARVSRSIRNQPALGK